MAQTCSAGLRLEAEQPECCVKCLNCAGPVMPELKLGQSCAAMEACAQVSDLVLLQDEGVQLWQRTQAYT